MKKVWNDIVSYWEQHVSLEDLRSGVNPGELEVLENYIAHPLPETFKEFYKIHNGWREPIIFPNPGSLLSADEILERWMRLNSRYPGKDNFEGCTSNSKEVKRVQWNPGWIPFTTCTRGRDHYCLDFDPTIEGLKGQVIFISMDMGDREFISSSFETFIKEYVQRLTEGKQFY